MKKAKKLLIWSSAISVFLLILLFLPMISFQIALSSHRKLNQKADWVPTVALILGAAVRSNYPTQILQNRLDKGIELYKAGKIKHFLLSGDNRAVDYNEPRVMKLYLVSKGVGLENITEDFGGLRTLDSCWRAKNVFKLSQVVIITQQFHLARTNFSCQNVGLKTFPVEALEANLQTDVWGYFREIPACYKAIIDTFGYEPPIKSDGTESDLHGV